MFARLRLWFLAFFRLSDEAVCTMSADMGLDDYHDYSDDLDGHPDHFCTLICRRCGKPFRI